MPLQKSMPPIGHFSPTPAPVSQQGSTVRDLCTDIVSRRFPNYRCKTDYELLTLAGGGPDYEDCQQISNWLDTMFKGTARSYGSEEPLNRYVEMSLACPLGEVTGLKPSGTDNSVLTHRIPESKYSFRLWPGSIERKEYCMDIVGNNGLPVNSDQAFRHFELSCEAPLLIPGISQTMPAFSLERGFGISQADIRPGEERFILVEGHIYKLQRRGKPDFTFTVPIR